MSNNNSYEFGEFHLDCQNFRLRHGLNDVPLQPRMFDTLVYFVEHAGEVVTKRDLIRAVWAEAAVQDNAMTRCISQLRKALGDADGARYIRTIPAKGYLFCAEVKLLSSNDKKTASPSPQPKRHSLWHTSFGYKLLAIIALSVILIIAIGSLLHKPDAVFIARQLTTNSEELPILAATISPDGNMIAFADETGLFVSDINTIDRHSLALPKDLLPSFIEWFPDGIHLLVSSNNPATHQATVWSFSVLGGAPILLLQNATKAVISPDGLRIAFIRNDTEVWLANADGSSATLFATALPNEIFAFRPQFSADNRSVVIGSANPQHDHVFIEIRHLDGSLATPLLETKRIVNDFRLIGSDELIVSWKPNLSNQGTYLTLQKISLNKGTLSSPRELLVLPNYVTFNISATHNGNMIALINSRMLSDVYIADLQANGTALSNSRRLTLNDSLNRPAGWLADNRTVLFYSDRSGRYGIYRQAIDSIDAYSIVNDDHINLWPAASFDQRWLFYFAVDSESGTATSQAKLMRIPPTGGKSVVIDDQVDTKHSLRCASAVNRCILASHVAGEAIYFAFDPEKGRGHELARTPWIPGMISYDWDISTDGMRIAYIDAASGTGLIGIITLGNKSATITHLHIIGQEQLRTLRWDAMSEGFYVSTFDEDQDELKLLHIATDGSVHVLRQQVNSFDGWAMSSPDGKHLAFQKYTDHSNIWLLQRQ